MAYLGLDIGLKRTGVAISESGIVARPLLPVLTRQNLIPKIVTMVSDYSIKTIIIGLPNRLNDDPTPQAELIEVVILEIRTALGLAGLTPNILTYNEFGTTRLAKQVFPTLDDNAGAATLLLQDYLDSQV